MSLKKIKKLFSTLMSIFLISSLLVGCIKNEDSNLEVEINQNKNEKTEEEIAKEEADRLAKEEADRLAKEEAEKEAKIQAIKDNPMMMLVNRDNLLASDFIPNDLVNLDINFQNYPNERTLKKEGADAAKEMFDAAKKDGVKLIGASGYRSYKLQKQIYDTRVSEKGLEEASKYIAIPGASEHQSGLALDILSTEYQNLDSGFENTEAFKWLIDNCHKYGFILRYLKGKEDITGYSYEPWHFRYIQDTEVAKYIMDNNLTFEEFHTQLNN